MGRRPDDRKQAFTRYIMLTYGVCDEGTDHEEWWLEWYSYAPPWDPQTRLRIRLGPFDDHAAEVAGAAVAAAQALGQLPLRSPGQA